MGAERRDRSVHDVLGQRQHLGSVGAVPRLDGGTAGDGMQHPLGLFTQGVASAVGELCRQLHDHILYIVHRHVRGHGAHDNSRAADVLGLMIMTPFVLALNRRVALRFFTGASKGKDILAASGLPIVSADDLGDAAKKIVAQVKGAA